MGCIILTDTERERSVFFCTTTERPLDHEAFIGDDSVDQAQDFLDWLNADPRDTKTLARKGYVDGAIDHSAHGGVSAWYPALDHALSAWRKTAFNEDDEFVGARPQEPTDEQVTRRGPYVMDGRSENDPSL